MSTNNEDRDAIDQIADLLCDPEWSTAHIEWVADIVGTVRPHPGGHETRDEYADLFSAATGRDVIERGEVYRHG
jgi:hypothetical protein